MDDLDKYLIEQMKDSEFKREWEASQSEFGFEESKIKSMIRESIMLTEEEICKFETSMRGDKSVELELSNRIFEWDYEKAEKNKRKHGVKFETAAKVFEDKYRLEEIDIKHSEEEIRYVTIGRVEDILYVVYTERGVKTRLITARLANKKERMKYYVKR